MRYGKSSKHTGCQVEFFHSTNIPQTV
jgi:hypothetical protein